VNSSLLLEGIFAPTAKKMKTASIAKGRAKKLFLSSSTETEGVGGAG